MHGKHDNIVFVFGALRSGTTVFRLMLDAHPQIGNPGEMDFLFDFLRKDSNHDTGWRYDLEALQASRIFQANQLNIPQNLTGLDLLDSFLEQIKERRPGKTLSINLHRHIDTAFDVIPNIRVLHMLRDPRDVARSSIQMGWAGTLYHGVDHWLKTETEWSNISTDVSPEQILEISYETLFQDIDDTLRRVCTFFQVPFDPNMLRYHENTTYGPPDMSLIEQWKRKCTPQELAEMESRAGPLMELRGYKRAQPHITLNSLQKAKLELRNKATIWKFGMARFGVATYLAEKLTRRVGLKTAHSRLARRMQQISIQHLK